MQQVISALAAMFLDACCNYDQFKLTILAYHFTEWQHFGQYQIESI